MLPGKTCKPAENLKILIAEDAEASSAYLAILFEELMALISKYFT